MSHVVSIETKVRDMAGIQAACHRLRLPEPVQGKARLFSEEVTGVVVNLPNWRYPIVCDLSSGQVQFDNFQGRWGDRRELDRFLQAYAVEKTKIEARKKGVPILEQPLSDGSIRLTVQLKGGTA